jgi:hypothetical protein
MHSVRPFRRNAGKVDEERLFVTNTTMQALARRLPVLWVNQRLRQVRGSTRAGEGQSIRHKTLTRVWHQRL